MSCLSWNCRGLGNPRAVSFLKEIVREKRPSFIFLIETLCYRNKIEEIKNLLGYDDFVSVDCVGHSGGLALLWRAIDSVHVLFQSARCIDVEVDLDSVGSWRLTGFYGHPNRNHHQESWALLQNLATMSTRPWVCMGDFNDILANHEKKGGRRQPNALIQGFRNAVMAAGLCDFPMSGYKFTWETGRGSDRWVEEKLDRVLTSPSFNSLFSHARAASLEASSSDHLPILLEIRLFIPTQLARRFKFENSWRREPQCRELISNVWNSSASVDVFNKLLRCGELLYRWGLDIRNLHKQELVQCKLDMQHLRGSRSLADVRKFEEAKKRYHDLLRDKEIQWKQRAKVFWLKEGDSNTRFFHAMATNRKKKNLIHRLQDSNGVWCERGPALDTLIVDYFQDIFQANSGDTQPIIDHIPHCITEEDNAFLLAPYSPEEARAAVFSMQADKAPGLDGFNPGFFQYHWDIIGSDVSSTCISMLAVGTFPVELNETALVLIPKKTIPGTMGDLRPIALCNVFYKIMSKMVANRLKRLLPRIISPSQSAFVAGRSIHDNTIIAFELMHFFKGKRYGRESYGALKMDISKAYDRMEWNYVSDVLDKMGFSTQWTSVIMHCITSVSYHIVHDGKELGPIMPTRGLRQGDSLSPYIFILCTEGLSQLISHKVASSALHGCRVARRCPEITHLFFADDSLIFFHSTAAEAQVVKEVVSTYAQASGQLINFTKSAICFSKNTRQNDRAGVCSVLGVEEHSSLGKYLGLPSVVGINKREIFGFLKDKVWQKLNSWKRRCLSRAGKEILLRTVLQALPNYVMSMFLIPKTLCHDLQQMMNMFWWGKGINHERGIHWMSWDRMSQPKFVGGLGFKKLREFNLAMVGKQAWNIVTNPSSLVARLIKARYFPDANFITARLGSNPSYFWRSIWEAQSVIKAGMCWKVGNGQQIRVWEDPWIPNLPSSWVQTSQPVNSQVNFVHDLMINGFWNLPLLRSIFSMEEQQAILSIPLPRFAASDRLIWKLEPKGQYSVKSVYKFLTNIGDGVVGGHISAMWRKLWNVRAPPKCRDLVWRAANNAIPVLQLLQQRHVPVHNSCPLCNSVSESVLHVLVTCPFAKRVWLASSIGWLFPQSASFLAWLCSVLQLVRKEDQAMVVMICWALWQARNDVVWSSKWSSPAAVVYRARTILYDWCNARHVDDSSSDAVPAPPPLHFWVPPLQGFLKANVDAAVFPDGFIGVGGVLRSYDGSFVGACQHRLLGYFSPKTAELIAIREVLSWIKRLGYDQIVLESDALTVVKALLSSSTSDFSSFGSLVDDCKSLIAEMNSVSVSFVPRSANSVAHLIARAASTISDRMEWLSTPPQLIVHALMLDFQI